MPLAESATELANPFEGVIVIVELALEPVAMDKLLGDDAVLMVPSAPGPAPVLNLPQNELNTYRKQLISLTSIAGLAKLPQA